MPNENITEVEESTQGQAPAAEAAPIEPAGTEAPAGGPDASEDSLPDWAKKELSKARGEAAKYRTSLRETEAKLAGAKTAEEFEAARAQLLEANRALERNLVAVKYGLPEALAKRLEGSTLEELEADAAALKGLLVPTPPKEPEHHPDASGGLTPGGLDEAEAKLTPAELARKYGPRHRILF